MASGAEPKHAITPDLIREHIESLPRRFRDGAANGIAAEVQLNIGGLGFVVAFADHHCMVREGSVASPHATVAASAETWFAIDGGKVTGPNAFQAGKLEVSGNLDLAVRLQTLFKPFGRLRRRSDFDQVEVKADGLRLSTYVVGKGEPLLMLHGLGGSKISWLPLVDALAQRHRVIVPDLPGHGESEKPVADYSPRFYAHVVRCLMDELDAPSAVVLGNSMGGRVALELALRSPARVSAMALLCPAVPGLRVRYILGFTRVLPAEFGAVPFPLRQQWMERMLRRLFADPSTLGDAAITAAAGEFIRVYRDPRARMAFFSSMRNVVTERPEVFWTSMRRVKQPTLVMVGDEDRIVPPKLGWRLANSLPHGELLALPNVGHVPQFEATTEALAALERFLAQHAPNAKRR